MNCIFENEIWLKTFDKNTQQNYLQIKLLILREMNFSLLQYQNIRIKILIILILFDSKTLILGKTDVK